MPFTPSELCLKSAENADAIATLLGSGDLKLVLTSTGETVLRTHSRSVTRLEIGLAPIFLCYSFQQTFGRFMRGKGCLTATDAFKRFEVGLFHANGIGDCQLCS